MTEEEKKEWEWSKGYGICILIEFLLIIWTVFYFGLTNHPEQYTWIWNYASTFFLILLCFVIFYAWLHPLLASKTIFITVVSLTGILCSIMIIKPIIDEYKDEKWQCYDRTTYDYERNNDIKCINKYWEVKLMRFEDAKKITDLSSRYHSRYEVSTDELYDLVNQHMYNSKWECVEYYNIFDKERDAYYWYELEDKIVELELNWIQFTDTNGRPHSVDFRLWEMYRATAKIWYLWCLVWCWLMSKSDEYMNCIFPSRNSY